MTRGRRIAATLLLAISLAILAWLGPGVVDRLSHPARYAISGRGRLAATAYVAATDRRVGRGARVAALTLTAGAAPVVVSVWPSTNLYLDPPTGQVLDMERREPARGIRPIAGAQAVTSVIERGRPYGGGGALRRIEWPTVRSPDWTLHFGADDATVKVADDSGTARAAPARRSGGAWVKRLPDPDATAVGARVAIVLGAIATAALALVELFRSARYRRVR